MMWMNFLVLLLVFLLQNRSACAFSAWRKLSVHGSVPPPLNGHTAVQFRGRMYIFGGCTVDGKCSSALYSFDPTDGLWTRHRYPPDQLVPDGREGHSGTLLGKFLYIYGGSNHNGILSDFYKLDLETLEWKSLKSGPGAQRFHAMIYYPNRHSLLLFGGMAEKLQGLYEYSPASDEWKPRRCMRGSGWKLRGSYEAFVMGIRGADEVFVTAGAKRNVKGDAKYDEKAYVFNMGTGECRTEKTKGLSPREGMASAKFEDHYFAAYGGCNADKEQCYNGLYVADLASGRLDFARTKLADKEFLPKVEGATLVAMDDSLLLFGGCEMLRKCSNEVILIGDDSINSGVYAQLDPSNVTTTPTDTTPLCPNNCSQKGICGANSTCYCKPGFTSKTCGLSLSEYAHGLIKAKAYIFFAACFVVGVFLGITAKCCYYPKKREDVPAK